MTINYGKRNPGGLTAASPGDRLYIPFSTYDSNGASVAKSSFAVTDIEVFKNGDVTARATDSGYSILTDTGQYGDRVGLHRFSVQIFNTADDTGFYDVGSQYHVAIDVMTVDGQAVRFFPAVFELGTERANITQIEGDTGAVNQLQAAFANGFQDTGVTNRFDRIQSEVDTGLRTHIDDLDTGLHDTIADLDTGLRDYVNNTDTGLRAFIDDIDTGIKQRFNALAEDTGGVNVNSIQGDTGAAAWLRATFAQGFTDTGLNQRLAQIQSDVDTGLRAQLADVDTGLHDAIADLDTGLRDHVDNTDTGLRRYIDNLDTGIKNRFDDLAEDTGGVNINAIQGDTGAACWLRATFANGFADTGIYSRLDKLPEDTGGVNINSIQGDTGAAAWLRATFAQGFADTGINERLGRIQSDVDTGLRAQLSDVDTGLHDAISDLDTGLRDYIDNTDTGLRAHIDDLDTGIKSRFDAMSEDTGGVNINAIAGDTGAASRLQQFAGTKLSSSGMVDTGTLAGTQPGTIDANVTYVNETPVQGTGSPGDEWRP